MVSLLRLFFSGVLVSMLFLTTTASLEQGIIQAGAELWPDAWFRATLADAYFGFLTIFVWIAYKERTATARLVWLGLLLSLGTIAVAVYLLLQLRQLKAGDSLERILLRSV